MIHLVLNTADKSTEINYTSKSHSMLIQNQLLFLECNESFKSTADFQFINKQYQRIIYKIFSFAFCLHKPCSSQSNHINYKIRHIFNMFVFLRNRKKCTRGQIQTKRCLIRVKSTHLSHQFTNKTPFSLPLT